MPKTKKEVIFTEADNSDYRHGEVFETEFTDEQQHYASTIGTQKRWSGKVKITIEQVE